MTLWLDEMNADETAGDLLTEVATALVVTDASPMAIRERETNASRERGGFTVESETQSATVNRKGAPIAPDYGNVYGQREELFSLDVAGDRQRYRYDVLTDLPSLFLLGKVISADGLQMQQLEELIANYRGWWHVIRLLQAGLVTLEGEYIQPTKVGQDAYQEMMGLLANEN